jgi:3-hydroxyisobutyrate dehydrogenase
MAKDLGLAMDIASQSGVDNQMGQLARDLYTRLQGAGMGQQDFSSVLTLLEQKN